jgi:hypothetical protein
MWGRLFGQRHDRIPFLRDRLHHLNVTVSLSFVEDMEIAHTESCTGIWFTRAIEAWTGEDGRGRTEEVKSKQVKFSYAVR